MIQSCFPPPKTRIETTLPPPNPSPRFKANTHFNSFPFTSFSQNISPPDVYNSPSSTLPSLILIIHSNKVKKGKNPTTQHIHTAIHINNKPTNQHKMRPSNRRPPNFDPAKAAQYAAMSDNELGKRCNSKMKSLSGLYMSLSCSKRFTDVGISFFKRMATKEGRERRGESDEVCRVV
jgi:hypothetical protein